MAGDGRGQCHGRDSIAVRTDTHRTDGSTAAVVDCLRNLFTGTSLTCTRSSLLQLWSFALRSAMFGLEVCEIRSIFPKILGLFVVDQLHAVDILQVGRLCLERLLLLGVQLLPSVTDQTSYLGEGQIFMFDFLANPVREKDVCGRGLFAACSSDLGCRRYFRLCSVPVVVTLSLLGPCWTAPSSTLTFSGVLLSCTKVLSGRSLVMPRLSAIALCSFCKESASVRQWPMARAVTVGTYPSMT